MAAGTEQLNAPTRHPPLRRHVERVRTREARGEVSSFDQGQQRGIIEADQNFPQRENEAAGRENLANKRRSVPVSAFLNIASFVASIRRTLSMVCTTPSAASTLVETTFAVWLPLRTVTTELTS